VAIVNHRGGQKPGSMPPLDCVRLNDDETNRAGLARRVVI
jgi:hypothetical protein